MDMNKLSPEAIAAVENGIKQLCEKHNFTPEQARALIQSTEDTSEALTALTADLDIDVAMAAMTVAYARLMARCGKGSVLGTFVTFQKCIHDLKTRCRSTSPSTTSCTSLTASRNTDNGPQ